MESRIQEGSQDWMERQLSLNESAIWPDARTDALREPYGTVLKGEAISMKSPRINAEGAMPTI